MRCHLHVLLLSLFLFACAGTPPAEQTVEPPEAPRFGPQTHLTAEGLGQTEGEAKRAAMAALGAIFQTRVRSEIESRAETYATALDSEQFEKEVKQFIQIESDVHLEGARIGWVKPDEASGGYRALAVLDRYQAAERWQNERDRIQTSLDAGMASLQSVKGRLQRLATLNRLSALVADRALIESRLSVIGRPVLDWQDEDLTALFTERDTLRETVAMAMQIDGPAADTFAHRLGSLLTDQGLRLASSPQNAAGLISGRAWVEPLALRNANAQFVRAVAEISIIDNDTGKVIGSFSENARKGHMDEIEAARLAIDQLAQQTARHLMESLSVFELE